MENSAVVDVAESVTVAENGSTAVTAADGVISMSRLPDSPDQFGALLSCFHRKGLP